MEKKYTKRRRTIAPASQRGTERLRRTQEEQKRAYEELERALSNPPPPIEQRHVALGGGYGADGQSTPFS